MSVRSGALAVAVAMIAAAQLGVAFAQTEPVVPPDLLAALQKDAKGDVNLECIREPDAPPLQDQVRAERFDLDRRQEAWLVYGINRCAAANNGPYFLYIRVDKGWRMILEGFGQSLGLGGSAGVHGWPDLALYMHGSASSGSHFFIGLMAGSTRRYCALMWRTGSMLRHVFPI
jgi:hypothetical protein